MIAENISVYFSDPSTTLPLLRDAEKSAWVILFFGDGGVTYSLYFGEIIPQKLYAVSVYPERSRKVPGNDLSVRIVRAFIRENEELLRDPRNCIGIWFDEETDITYLDISMEKTTLKGIVILLDILPGATRAILTGEETRFRGSKRLFTQKVPVLDAELFQRLQVEAQKGDPIEVTVVTEWRDDHSITYLSDFRATALSNTAEEVVSIR